MNEEKERLQMVAEYAEMNLLSVEAFKGMILGVVIAEISTNVLYHMGIYQKLIKN